MYEGYSKINLRLSDGSKVVVIATWLVWSNDLYPFYIVTCKSAAHSVYFCSVTDKSYSLSLPLMPVVRCLMVLVEMSHYLLGTFMIVSQSDRQCQLTRLSVNGKQGQNCPELCRHLPRMDQYKCLSSQPITVRGIQIIDVTCQVTNLFAEDLPSNWSECSIGHSLWILKKLVFQGSSEVGLEDNSECCLLTKSRLIHWTEYRQ